MTQASSTLRIATPRAFVPLLKPARHKGAHGGRSSGKSHFFGDLWLEENVSAAYDFVCLREVQKSLEFSVKKLLESKIAANNAGAYFDVQDKRIQTRHGGTTIFQGMQNHTAESIKSLEGFDRAWVEEAQTLGQLSLDMLRPTIRKEGSQLWFSWNPRTNTDPVDAFLRGSEIPPDSIIVQANYRDNPFLSSVSRADLEYDQRRDPDKFAHIWLGEYQRNSEARVFKNWSIEEFESPSNATFRLGADWGFSIDPTVLIRCFVGRWEKGIAIPDEKGRHLFIDYEAHEVGCEINMTPQLFDTVPDARRWLITADSARPETISYMQKNGFPKIHAAIKGPRSIEEGVEFLKSYDIVVHRRCTHAVDDLTLYSFEIDKLTGAVTNKLADKSNNVIDSLRYACEGARRARAAKPQEEDEEAQDFGGAGWMN